MNKSIVRRAVTVLGTSLIPAILGFSYAYAQATAPSAAPAASAASPGYYGAACHILLDECNAKLKKSCTSADLDAFKSALAPLLTEHCEGTFDLSGPTPVWTGTGGKKFSSGGAGVDAFGAGGGSGGGGGSAAAKPSGGGGSAAGKPIGLPDFDTDPPSTSSSTSPSASASGSATPKEPHRKMTGDELHAMALAIERFESIDAKGIVTQDQLKDLRRMLAATCGIDAATAEKMTTEEIVKKCGERKDERKKDSPEAAASASASAATATREEVRRDVKLVGTIGGAVLCGTVTGCQYAAEGGIALKVATSPRVAGVVFGDVDWVFHSPLTGTLVSLNTGVGLSFAFFNRGFFIEPRVGFRLDGTTLDSNPVIEDHKFHTGPFWGVGGSGAVMFVAPVTSQFNIVGGVEVDYGRYNTYHDGRIDTTNGPKIAFHLGAGF